PAAAAGPAARAAAAARAPARAAAAAWGAATRSWPGWRRKTDSSKNGRKTQITV
ncbi:MAG: OmpA family protein, partial [Hymenobacter sp.]